MHKLLGPQPGVPDPSALGPDDVLELYFTPHGVQSVIQRDDANLTPGEFKEHHEAVRAARLKELKHWAGFKGFHRA
eukprot:7502041-Lingulodinium_polyedra.AAC.1